ncbi:MAG: hypothetical protein ACOYD4_17165, partial [Solirubrobacterales bacterium]
MALAAEILSDLADAETVSEEWDRLATGAGESFSAPGWALAWWRHVAPAGAGLRLVVVRDEGELVGVAPLWAVRAGSRSSRYEALGGRLASPAGPLAAPGREPEVAAELGRAL